jgi:hypothetical protein
MLFSSTSVLNAFFVPASNDSALAKFYKSRSTYRTLAFPGYHTPKTSDESKSEKVEQK